MQCCSGDCATGDFGTVGGVGVGGWRRRRLGDDIGSSGIFWGASSSIVTHRFIGPSETLRAICGLGSAVAG